MSEFPTLTGKGEQKGCHEIHIFVAPIFAPKTTTTDELIRQESDFSEASKKYENHVALWNTTRLPEMAVRDQGIVTHTEMKKPVLTLIFRDGKGEQPVTVCQSARHVFCDDQEKIISLAKEDAEYFESAGFTVLRIKIEAMAYGLNGIPQNSRDSLYFPTCYFEFHILVQHVSADETAAPQLMTETEEKELRRVSNVVSRNLAVPVPLSFNRTKNQGNIKNGGCQRFLNARFRKQGILECAEKIERIVTEIENSGNFKVMKKISEFVWWDTLPAMDQGWIDYTEAEQMAVQGRLMKEN